jgi:hypothetical protein
LRNVVLL